MQVNRAVRLFYTHFFLQLISNPANLYFRYLVKSLDSDSPRLSYIGVALSKEHYISWISQVKSVLYHCMTGLDGPRPEIPADHRSVLLRLHTLVSFTASGTWAIQKVEGMEKLEAGMKQLCANIMGHLVNNGFYTVMRVNGINRHSTIFYFTR